MINNILYYYIVGAVLTMVFYIIVKKYKLFEKSIIFEDISGSPTIDMLMISATWPLYYIVFIVVHVVAFFTYLCLLIDEKVFHVKED